MNSSPPSPLARWKATLEAVLWGRDEDEALPWYHAWLVGTVRLIFAVGRDLAEGQLTLRAMSLVYTTLLSLVPLLAISFSVLKGFGVHNQIEPLLLNLLAPLGEKGIEVTERIISFVENVKVGVLGSVGLALLFYTVVSLMQKIERAFNFIWHIARERSFMQRFSHYLSVLVVGPVLVFTSIGISASVMRASIVGKVTTFEPIGAVVTAGGWLAPYILTALAFTFIYMFIPNTRVRFRSALIGGVVAGVLWNVSGWLFASFVVTSVRYAAIYSTFATLIMFMIWLYLGWLILLLGASIGFYHQRPEYVTVGRGPLMLGNRSKERLAMLTVHMIASRFYAGRPAWTADALAHRLRAPLEILEQILITLEERGLLAQTGDEPPAFLPARPLETTRLSEVLDAVRSADDAGRFMHLPPVPAVDALLAESERAAATALGDRTLKDMALSAPAGSPRSHEAGPIAALHEAPPPASGER